MLMINTPVKREQAKGVVLYAIGYFHGLKPQKSESSNQKSNFLHFSLLKFTTIVSFFSMKNNFSVQLTEFGKVIREPHLGL